MDISGSLTNWKLSFFNKQPVYEQDGLFVLIDGNAQYNNYEQELINLYKQYGDSFVSKITDFISVYFFDKNKNKLFLINDRIGTKCIYYHVSSDGNIIFGNDLMLVVNNCKNIDKKINIKSLSIYFRYDCVPAPETIFENVYKVKNGHYILINTSNSPTDKCYWDVFEIFNNKNKVKNICEAQKNIKNKIVSFAQKYLEEKNKTAIYMSGGIDSTLLASIVTNNTKEKPNTISIGFFSDMFNEADKSKRIANYLGTNHREFYIDKKSAYNIVQKMPFYYTEPLGDPSQVATVVLNEFARQNNIDFALTGDGADQLFCGSPIYDTLYKVQKLRKMLNPLGLKFKFSSLKKHYKAFAIFYDIDDSYLDQFNILFYENKISGLIKGDTTQLYNFETQIKTKNLQEKRMVLDLNSFIPDRVLTKMHVAANKNNIEIRSPYLTQDFIEYALSVDHTMKYHKKIKKYILKEILYKYVPREFFDNKKRGFAIPTVEWLKTCFNKDLKRLSTKEFVEKQNLFNYDVVQKIINDIDTYPNAVWDYYMFQLWYEKHVANN